MCRFAAHSTHGYIMCAHIQQCTTVALLSSSVWTHYTGHNTTQHTAVRLREVQNTHARTHARTHAHTHTHTHTHTYAHTHAH